MRDTDLMKFKDFLVDTLNLDEDDIERIDKCVDTFKLRVSIKKMKKFHKKAIDHYWDYLVKHWEGGKDNE